MRESKRKSLASFKEIENLTRQQYISRLKYDKHKPNKYFSFDKTIHATLAEFNREVNEDKRSIQSLFHILNKNWVSDGYKDFDDERKFKVRAHAMLINYYRSPLDIGHENLMINKIVKSHLEDQRTLWAKIDKVVEYADGCIELIDYKTGKVISHSDNFQLDLKSATYMFLIKDKLSIYPNKISYYYLTYNTKFTHVFQPEDISTIHYYLDLLLN